MPDNLDYEWLAELMATPEAWTPADLAGAEAIVATQRRATEEAHPEERARPQAVVTALESAIEQYRTRHAD